MDWQELLILAQAYSSALVPVPKPAPMNEPPEPRQALQTPKLASPYH